MWMTLLRGKAYCRSDDTSQSHTTHLHVDIYTLNSLFNSAGPKLLTSWSREDQDGLWECVTAGKCSRTFSEIQQYCNTGVLLAYYVSLECVSASSRWFVILKKCIPIFLKKSYYLQDLSQKLQNQQNVFLGVFLFFFFCVIVDIKTDLSSCGGLIFSFVVSGWAQEVEFSCFEGKLS